jgi:hypothetical protein
MINPYFFYAQQSTSTSRTSLCHSGPAAESREKRAMIHSGVLRRDSGWDREQLQKKVGSICTFHHSFYRVFKMDDMLIHGLGG